VKRIDSSFRHILVAAMATMVILLLMIIQFVPCIVDELDDIRQSGSVQWRLAVIQKDVCLTEHNMVACPNFRVECQQRSDTVRPFLQVVVLLMMVVAVVLMLMMTVMVEVQFQI